MNVATNATKGSATIEFTQVAKTTGKIRQRKMVEDFRPNDQVALKLEFWKRKWWIVDPPIPRFTLEYMLNQYSQLFNRLYSPEDGTETRLSATDKGGKALRLYQWHKESFELTKMLKQKYSITRGHTGQSQ